MNWRFAYAIGFHSWEDAVDDPAFVQKAAEVFAREEHGREPPYGRALDLGTGSGIWGIELAKRGWQVTGIDRVEKALMRARDRVREAGIEMRLLHGDVTALRAADVGSDFQLLLDTGTFHDINTAQREAVGREICAVAAPDATVLLLVWPKRRRPLIRGASRSEIEAAFPGWKVSSVEPPHFSTGGYAASEEELSGADAQGETLEEARENLREGVALVIEANRALAGEEAGDGDVIREPLRLTA